MSKFTQDEQEAIDAAANVNTADLLSENMENALELANKITDFLNNEQDTSRLNNGETLVALGLFLGGTIAHIAHAPLPEGTPNEVAMKLATIMQTACVVAQTAFDVRCEEMAAQRAKTLN